MPIVHISCLSVQETFRPLKNLAKKHMVFPVFVAAFPQEQSESGEAKRSRSERGLVGGGWISCFLFSSLSRSPLWQVFRRTVNSKRGREAWCVTRPGR